ncbi:hypothetical protein VTJ04DRAFT_4617 [Mycothermus thermophilus]|uniref:uncharacterized protein n=1 Tax=Humicola insolens TaxID=85995 RepID=UPI00374412E2
MPVFFSRGADPPPSTIQDRQLGTIAAHFAAFDFWLTTGTVVLVKFGNSQQGPHPRTGKNRCLRMAANKTPNLIGQAQMSRQVPEEIAAAAALAGSWHAPLPCSLIG